MPSAPIFSMPLFSQFYPVTMLESTDILVTIVLGATVEEPRSIVISTVEEAIEE